MSSPIRELSKPSNDEEEKRYRNEPGSSSTKMAYDESNDKSETAGRRSQSSKFDINILKQTTIHITRSKLKTAQKDIDRSVKDPSTITPYRRRGEGTKPIFDRPELEGKINMPLDGKEKALELERRHRERSRRRSREKSTPDNRYSRSRSRSSSSDRRYRHSSRDYDRSRRNRRRSYSGSRSEKDHRRRSGSPRSRSRRRRSRSGERDRHSRRDDDDDDGHNGTHHDYHGQLRPRMIPPGYRGPPIYPMVPYMVPPGFVPPMFRPPGFQPRFRPQRPPRHFKPS